MSWQSVILGVVFLGRCPWIVSLPLRHSVWYLVPISDSATKVEVQTSLLSNNGPGELTTGSDKLVRYARHWIPEESFVSAHRE